MVVMPKIMEMGDLGEVGSGCGCQGGWHRSQDDLGTLVCGLTRPWVPMGPICSQPPRLTSTVVVVVGGVHGVVGSMLVLSEFFESHQILLQAI